MDQYSFPARLKAARKAAGYKTSKAFVEAHNIGHSTYSQHETGQRNPPSDVIKTYSEILKVNYDWLKTGEGDPYSNKKKTTKQKSALDNEMLDLNQYKSKSALPEKINENLLTEILKMLFDKSKPLKLPLEKIVHIASGIYSDITEIEAAPSEQIKLVKTAVTVYMRHHKK